MLRVPVSVYVVRRSMYRDDEANANFYQTAAHGCGGGVGTPLSLTATSNVSKCDKYQL